MFIPNIEAILIAVKSHTDPRDLTPSNMNDSFLISVELSQRYGGSAHGAEDVPIYADGPMV